MERKAVQGRTWFIRRKGYVMAKLIKIDRNGSKHYEGYIECDRCQGRGLYAIGVCNGELVITSVDNGICHKCGGSGKVWSKWIERTPEYQAKLDARREAKLAKWREEHAEEIAQRRAEEEARAAEEKARKEAEEARIKAEKAISQYVGQEGERITFTATYLFSAYFEVKAFYGFGTETVYIHNFKDENGNKYIWKTRKGFCCDNKSDEGMKIILTGTVKEHKEYKDEKQTVLTRCRCKGA